MDLFGSLHRAWARRSTYRAAYRTAYRELAGYSDRELQELGLSRGDIVRVACEEALRVVGPAPEPARRGPAAPLLTGHHRHA